MTVKSIFCACTTCPSGGFVEVTFHYKVQKSEHVWSLNVGPQP